MKAIRERINLNSVRAFYMGNLYPAIICLIVCVGSISGFEFYLGILHMTIAVFGLVVSESIKPVVISLLTFVMQLSVPHSPFYPSYSDYYYTGWRLYAVIFMAAAAIFGFVFFIVKRKIYKRISPKNSPLLIPLTALFFAILLNGAFSGRWTLGNLVFGFANAVVLCVLPLILYHGFSDDEDSGSIAGYFSYLSLLIALVIISELVALFITNDNVITDGSINKVEVALGWGIWNLVGVSLTVLLPVLFFGVQNNRYPWIYFAVATLTLVFSVLTMSRGALVFGSLAYAACVIISCFKGKHKRTFRLIVLIGVMGAIILSIIFWSKISAVFKDYFDRGFSDNGRFALWRAAFSSFLSDPIFGGGFYGLDVDDSLLFSFGPLAKQAHNTVFQLLSATGIVGFLAYAYYRLKTLKTVFCRPTLKKTFMALSIAVLLLGSLLDNFVFNIYPMFYYTVALTVILREDREIGTLSLD